MGCILRSLGSYTGSTCPSQVQPSPSRIGFRQAAWSTQPRRCRTADFDGNASRIAPGYAVNDDWVALKQQVREANDIVDVVGGYIPLRQVGPTFKGLCPFHDDQHPSFDVDPRRQRYRCWACSKFGDVFSFVMEHERVSFQEALELLARKAGISLEKLKKNPSGPSRAVMLDVMRWAQEQYAQCLLESPQGEAARNYLRERGVTGEMVRRFGLGFAPGSGSWLNLRAANLGLSTEIMELVGLIAKSNDGRGYYDRFRDRVMFPIRDLGGRVVAFGGRILPSSPSADKAAKYYNSAETPIFHKSSQLYGIDLAHKSAAKVGVLAVVEGYMDVMMAHQYGITNVVAPMGTALTAKHIQKLRGLTKRVVLVFDADAGGSGGVDRALELFVSQELDLRIGLLPEGLDPCDLLMQEGAVPFQHVLDEAVDVFEFKLRQVWPSGTSGTVEDKRAAVEKMLTVLSAAPKLSGVKMELMVNRIAHLLSLKEETIWTRLRELAAVRGATDRPERGPAKPEEPPVPRSAPAARHEVELLELMLAEPKLVSRAKADLVTGDLEHPGLIRMANALFDLLDAGLVPDVDHLRNKIDSEKLLEHALIFQDRGLFHADKAAAYDKVIGRFREIRGLRAGHEIKNQVSSVNDHDQARELLRKLKV